MAHATTAPPAFSLVDLPKTPSEYHRSSIPLTLFLLFSTLFLLNLAKGL